MEFTADVAEDFAAKIAQQTVFAHFFRKAVVFRRTFSFTELLKYLRFKNGYFFTYMHLCCGMKRFVKVLAAKDV